MIHGRGVSAKINEKMVLAGNEKMLEESQIILPAEQKKRMSELAITGILNPVVGALVHNAGSVIVIINSALLLQWKQK